MFPPLELDEDLLPKLDKKSPPRAGTIFIYSSQHSVLLEQPDFLDRFVGFTAQCPARETSSHVLRTVQREFRLEDQYRASIYGKKPAPRKKWRAPHRRSEWRPESVYKTYVELKPSFFDRSDYQDNIPSGSCFGKINMRVPKAWTRGPNRAKRLARQPHLRPLRRRLLPDPHISLPFPPQPPFAPLIPHSLPPNPAAAPPNLHFPPQPLLPAFYALPYACPTFCNNSAYSISQLSFSSPYAESGNYLSMFPSEVSSEPLDDVPGLKQEDSCEFSSETRSAVPSDLFNSPPNPAEWTAEPNVIE